MNQINDTDQTITVTNLVNNEKMIQEYDELVLATGSSPKELPQLNSEEYNNVFKVKNINDAKAIYNYIESNDVQNITIIGGGFIGLEMLEQLSNYNTSIIQRSTFMPHLDYDISFMIQEYIEDKANVYTNNEIDIIDYDENHTINRVSLKLAN